MTRKEFYEKQSDLNKRIDDLERERAELERQWYNEINRRLDILRGRCFVTRGCKFMVYGAMNFKKTQTAFYFEPRMIPVMMIQDNGVVRMGTIRNSVLVDNDAGEDILREFRKEFEEITRHDFTQTLESSLRLWG